MTGIIMFFAALLMLGIGYPVAFTFGSISIFFGIIAAIVAVAPDISFMAVSDEFLRMFSMMPFRVYSIMNNTILMAIPLFIFMGIILQRSQLAEQLLESMGTLFGRVRGGIAVSTVLVGTLLAASTGVVGASVVAMGVISLPVMLKYGYSKPLATGTICAAGTLGQIIPPSVILVILGDVFQLPVGDLFAAAFAPGFGLVGAYIVFILIWAFLNKDVAPAMPPQEGTRMAQYRPCDDRHYSAAHPDHPGAGFDLCRYCHAHRIGCRRLCRCGGPGGHVPETELADRRGIGRRNRQGRGHGLCHPHRRHRLLDGFSLQRRRPHRRRDHDRSSRPEMDLSLPGDAGHLHPRLFYRFLRDHLYRRPDHHTGSRCHLGRYFLRSIKFIIS